MVSLLTWFMWISSLAGPGEAEAIGYLYQPSFDVPGELRGAARPYHPAPGDIFLSTDKLWIAVIGHKMAGAKGIHHSGLIILRPDGSAGSLEAAPHHVPYVRVLGLVENMGRYEEEGNAVWVRQRKTPLTAEQCNKLTQFAMAQDGKLFAWWRVAAQVTALRSRSHVRYSSMGTPNGDRKAYYCSELALETLLAAGLLDPNRTRPSATYPSELFFGASDIAFINDTLDINASWEPPARWSLYLPK
jgi:hypothetical protein